MPEPIDPTTIFLDIERKKDSVAKLEAAQGKPHDEFLFAPEFNKVVKAINMLKSMITLSVGQIQEIIATGIKVDVGEVETDVVVAINASIEGYRLGLDGTTFITCVIEGIYYVYAFAGEPAIYGSINNIDAGMLLLLFDGSNAAAKNYYEFNCTVTQDDSGIWVKAYNDEFTEQNFTVSVIPLDGNVGVRFSVYQQSEVYDFYYDAISSKGLPGENTEIVANQMNARQLYVETFSAGIPTANLLNSYYVTIKAFKRTNEFYQQP